MCHATPFPRVLGMVYVCTCVWWRGLGGLGACVCQEGDSVTVVLTDEEREVLRSESAAARQWLEEHPSATLAEVTARECRVDDAVGAILIKATMAARKK